MARKIGRRGNSMSQIVDSDNNDSVVGMHMRTTMMISQHQEMEKIQKALLEYDLEMSKLGVMTSVIEIGLKGMKDYIKQKYQVDI